MASTNDGPKHVETEPAATWAAAPGVGELQDVEDTALQTALTDVGTAARQPDDHPYNPDDDPDSEYTAREQRDSRAATTPSEDGRHYQPDYPAGAAEPGTAAMTLDPDMPQAAPRAGG